MISLFEADTVKWNVKNECKILPQHRIEQYYEKNEGIKELAQKALWVRYISGIIWPLKFCL